MGGTLKPMQYLDFADNLFILSIIKKHTNNLGSSVMRNFFYILFWGHQWDIGAVENQLKAD